MRSPCRFGSPWELERCPRLHRTGDISADDKETADKRRVGAAAQRCRLLASPLEAEGRAGWSLSSLLSMKQQNHHTAVIQLDNMHSKINVS